MDFYHDITIRKMEEHERMLLIKRANTEDTTYVEALLEQLRQRIDETNRSIPELNLSISYGYAMRSEIEENIPEKVYQLSDNRMYEYKRIYKQQREG
ncbi:MAG: diguanylate cyclase [Lachnospiraceae bacterium]|nr:diguanylate cyclase [Lachnospiraceae bacterium]